MSRAIPSSYNEYLYTSPTDMICNGGIMPLRNGSAGSTDWKYCLRGEDPIFLNEAMHIRGLVNGSGTNIAPDKYIRASKMAAFRDAIAGFWSSGRWSATNPNIPAGVVQNQSSWDDYIDQYFTLSARQSAGDAYTILDANQVMNLFKDTKQLNYSYATGSRGSVVPYGDSQSCTYTVHYEENRPAYQPADPDHDETTTSYLWYSDELYLWRKNQGYPGDLEQSRTYTPKSSSVTFTEMTSTPANVAKTCVAIQPYAEMEVYNFGETGDDYNTTDLVQTFKYVVVPLKSGFTDMLNATVPTISSSEIDTAVSLAFTTAELAKNSSDIQLIPATGDSTKRHATSTCRITTLFYVVHIMYCNLESVSIT